jgi:hypothetical protein
MYLALILYLILIPIVCFEFELNDDVSLALDSVFEPMKIVELYSPCVAMLHRFAPILQHERLHHFHCHFRHLIFALTNDDSFSFCDRCYLFFFFFFDLFRFFFFSKR